eukprot:CAMPEP_0202970182 /NCGR_PEP_ID=MMETSP1396-20130829/16167_1 /ASSEMBLY_ACC=CAM_ASM_000872 /TAXON_ID= /ORGANISM="Pseudokeronopsis sp., Strain Brazil" /LENGTH=160 /DNA_ID=CAMNT_0049698537 /DNA_START=871 /DNA_END=1355 /DNA_ORIENTATION=+
MCLGEGDNSSVKGAIQQHKLIEGYDVVLPPAEFRCTDSLEDPEEGVLLRKPLQEETPWKAKSVQPALAGDVGGEGGGVGAEGEGDVPALDHRAAESEEINLLLGPIKEEDIPKFNQLPPMKRLVYALQMKYAENSQKEMKARANASSQGETMRQERKPPV